MKFPRSVLGLALTAALAAPGFAQDAPQPTAPAPAPAPQPPRIGESVVAVVNDEVITTYDVNQRLLLLLLETRIQPTQEQIPALQREALRLLVDETLQMQELRRIDKERKTTFVADDEAVSRAMVQIGQQMNLTPDQFVAMLQETGLSPRTMRERLRVDLSWRRFIGARYGIRARAGREQVQATLKRIAESVNRPQYYIREIFIEGSRVGGQAEAMNGAQQLIAQIQQGAPFEAVAQQFSAAPSAARGGDAGWLSSDELPAQLRPTIEQMNPGELRAIPVSDGVYIVQLRQRSSGAGATVVNLKQAALRLAQDAPQTEVDAAQARLTQLRSQITGCEDLEAKAGAVDGVVAGDLGEAEINDLAPQFREAAQRLQPGQISEPVRTEVGLHLVAVCSKRAGGAQVPTADEVEERLFEQQLSMLSRRYLRDLRNTATLETR